MSRILKNLEFFEMIHFVFFCVILYIIVLNCYYVISSRDFYGNSCMLVTIRRKKLFKVIRGKLTIILVF